MLILRGFAAVSSLIRRCFGSLGAPGLSSSRKVQERQIKRPATDLECCAQIWVECGDGGKTCVIPPWCGVISRRCVIIPRQRGNSADFAGIRRCFVVDSALFWLLGGAGIELELKGAGAPDQKACYRRWALRSNLGRAWRRQQELRYSSLVWSDSTQVCNHSPPEREQCRFCSVSALFRR